MNTGFWRSSDRLRILSGIDCRETISSTSTSRAESLVRFLLRSMLDEAAFSFSVRRIRGTGVGISCFWGVSGECVMVDRYRRYQENGGSEFFYIIWSSAEENIVMVPARSRTYHQGDLTSS